VLPLTRLVEAQMSWPGRDVGCGDVSEVGVGDTVTVCGWVDRYRNHGGVLFVDVRDHTGVLQVQTEGRARAGTTHPI
jgi:aspartyl-tRNA synthetase